MGVAVSNWSLARTVSQCGELGVVSGTALDSVLVRRLQDGDLSGEVRRALAAFPDQEMVAPIVEKWFIEGGKAKDQPYRLKPMPTVKMRREEEVLTMVANFVEVSLAKEGHSGVVGINLLEKIQLPTLPSLYGAMLAGVDAVLMGGGIPLAIPAVLDALSKSAPVELKVNMVSTVTDQTHLLQFDPSVYPSLCAEALKRPQFIAVISSDILAKTLVKKASGSVDGFVVEHYDAGGHNAPPRREGAYGPRDTCNLEKLIPLGKPFWLAGGCASPQRFREAKALGARGIQVGTAFACSDESGALPEIKRDVIERHRNGTLEVITDFKASPTGYPFKRLVPTDRSVSEPCRVCDLGYLRHVYEKVDGSIAYRCPAGPRERYLASGGTEAEAEGKHCLCNGLMATIGLGQIRDGQAIPPLITFGENLSFLDSLLQPFETSYTAEQLIAHLRSEVEVEQLML
ncbi:MAG TPA: 2-nitropropane dioxygenase [Opitutae bacterium]|nr:2-nitropropane dioxygenase [Opitutae bacterium]